MNSRSCYTSRVNRRPLRNSDLFSSFKQRSSFIGNQPDAKNNNISFVNQKSYYFINRIDDILNKKKSSVQTQLSDRYKNNIQILGAYKKKFGSTLADLQQSMFQRTQPYSYKRKVDSEFSKTERSFLNKELLNNRKTSIRKYNEDISITEQDVKQNNSEENLQTIKQRNQEFLENSFRKRKKPNYRSFHEYNYQKQNNEILELQRKLTNSQSQKHLMKQENSKQEDQEEYFILLKKIRQQINNSLKSNHNLERDIISLENLLHKVVKENGQFDEENCSQIENLLNKVCELFGVEYEKGDSNDIQITIIDCLNYFYDEIQKLITQNEEITKNEELKENQDLEDIQNQLENEERKNQSLIDEKNSFLKKINKLEIAVQKAQKRESQLQSSNQKMKIEIQGLQEQLEDQQLLAPRVLQIQREKNEQKFQFEEKIKEKEKIIESLRQNVYQLENRINQTNKRISRQITRKLGEEQFKIEEESSQSENKLMKSLNLDDNLNSEDSQDNDTIAYIDEQIEIYVQKYFKQKEEEKEQIKLQLQSLEKEKEKQLKEMEDLRIQNQKYKITALNMNNLTLKNTKLKKCIQELQQQLKIQQQRICRNEDQEKGSDDSSLYSSEEENHEKDNQDINILLKENEMMKLENQKQQALINDQEIKLMQAQTVQMNLEAQISELKNDQNIIQIKDEDSQEYISTKEQRKSQRRKLNVKQTALRRQKSLKKLSEENK